MNYADIAIPSPLPQLFTYRVPEEWKGRAKPGFRAVIPFRNKNRIGIILHSHSELSKELKKEKIKNIEAIPDELPLLSSKTIDWLRWLADYYFAPIGEVCRAALPSRLFDLKIKTGASPRVKEDHNHFEKGEILTLTKKQKEAIDIILKSTHQESPKPILLHGITGSGKTEIYLNVIEKLLEEKKQIILLVPEISLTPQLIGWVSSRLKQEIAIYHSALTDSQRHAYWEKMRLGSLNVVVGTRSALFAPFQNLGLIIVDEEQDASYKQQESFYYHARDAAIVRGKNERVPVLLGSATPSLESFYNAKQKKYDYIHLSDRATGASLPQVQLVDLRNQKPLPEAPALSQALREAITKKLERKEQSLLLLNRRGFSNLLICEDCGHTWRCLNCDISLTYHTQPPRLLCHYCDLSMMVPSECPTCRGVSIKPLGEGTERLEEDLKKMFPKAKIARLDRDTATQKHVRQKVLASMYRQEVDILIGTQMIAKGHDFSNVTLVGVIGADTPLHLPDFRSAERTFQLLTQVAGRSGRDQKPGVVFIQTFQPEHYSLQNTIAHDYEKFA